MDEHLKTGLLDRLSDRINPLVVREVRRSFKSRVFIYSFFLSLFISWLITLFFCISITEHEMDNGKPGFFLCGFYLITFGSFLFLFLPYSTFKSMQSEREHNTEELLVISNISAGRLIGGNIWTACVSMFLLFCVITPFIAFSALFNGFDILLVFLVICEIFFISLGFIIFGMMLPTLSKKSWWQVFSEMFYWVFLLVTLFSTFMAARNIFHPAYSSHYSVTDPIQAYISGSVYDLFNSDNPIINFLFLNYELLIFYSIMLAQVSFESSNRSSLLRKVIFFWSLFLSAYLIIQVSFGITAGISSGGWTYYTPASSSMSSSAPAFSIFDVLILQPHIIKNLLFITPISYFLAGVYLVSEPEIISRRTSSGFSKFYLFRMISSIFIMGGSRGYLLVGLLLITNFITAFYLLNDNLDSLIYLAGMSGYALLILSIQCLFSNEVQGEHRYQNHERMMTMLISFAAFFIPDYILGILGHGDYIPRFGFYYQYPQSYYTGFENSLLFQEIFIFVAFIGAVSIGINTFVIVRGFLAINKNHDADLEEQQQATLQQQHSNNLPQDLQSSASSV